MFTGIVKEVGKICRIEEKSGNRIFEVECRDVVVDKKIGDSIAVDGVCHTVVKLVTDGFVFQSIPETLKLTTMGEKALGDKVNLEAAMKLSDTLDGHLVLGHVDCKAMVESIKEDHVMSFELPKGMEKYLAYKGSVCVNGISLTVSALQERVFSVSLIPHTWENTTMCELKVGDDVNIEIDPLMRYVERVLGYRDRL